MSSESAISGDDCSSDDNSEISSMSSSLATWLVKYKVPRDGGNELLKILRDNGSINNLPIDVRTLF